ncbi:tetratricopeptide repeat protein (plasmid) [Agrobacterium vaccinii]|uniref:tetratricopeptide repeat protein n=1 Tax=Agrobacterium TaxID=357 RepID=UPI001E461A76|nr:MULTISPECIES: tetratricopeptide repeat protein [Agrobacterium]UHS64483.1 tetratricopeptide repeat protein [Agrobacterium vaccinii]
MTGDFAAALQDFDRAVALDPKMALAWGYRGLARARLGEIEKGVADLKEAARLDPLNPMIAAALEEAEVTLSER